MAINYTTLTAAKTTEGSIKNWVNRSDIPVTNILLEAEAWIYQRLRVREMIADEAFTFDEDASSEALPAGFLDPVQFVPYQWACPLMFVHEGSFRPSRTTAGVLQEGTPSMWTIIGTTAHVDVLCSSDFAGRLLYYKQPDALSGDNETNFLTTRYPTLLRSALMMKAFEHMRKTSDAAGYLQKAMADIQEAAATNDMWRRGQYAWA